jgi:UDP-N-acetylmuramyl pentapeptide synthase
MFGKSHQIAIDPINDPRKKPVLWLRIPYARVQKLARDWRTRFNTRIIGITGSVGKTSTKELTHAVLVPPLQHFEIHW